MQARKSAIPSGSLIMNYLPADYADTFACETEYVPYLSPDDIMVNFWTDFPQWVNALFRLRNFLVKFVGLKGDGENMTQIIENCVRTGGSNNSISVPAKSGQETVLLLTDKHLNAYISVFVEENDKNKNVFVTTVVHFHNRLGRIYFFFVRSFHNLIVKKMLKRAVDKATAQTK